jgi:DNA-binding transcriptional MerR regulator
MSRPTRGNARKYHTLPYVSNALNASTETVKRWHAKDLLPPPTLINIYGVRYYSDQWIADAKRTVAEKLG